MRGFGRDKPIAYGIDFGTSNSTIAVAYRDRVEPLPIEARSTTPSVVPSIIYLHRDHNRVAGQQAVQQFTLTGSQRTRCGNCSLVRIFDGRPDTLCMQHRSGSECQDARLISGIKSSLADTRRTGTKSWAVEFKLDDLVAVVLRRLKTSADRVTGADVKRVVLGHPVSFVGAEGPDYKELQQTALARLEQAARIAGFTEVELLEEPAAVLNNETEDGIVLAADFGGGTFDVAVTKFTADGGDVLALTGAEIGGEDFDKRLFQAKVASALHLTDRYRVGADPDGEQLPSRMLKRLASLSGLNLLLSDRETLATLNRYRNAPGGERLSAVRSILYGGHAYEFYRAIEEAKIGLSAQHSASIEFQRPGINISVPVQRVEFEAMIADLLQVVRGAVIQALSESGIGPESVSLVLLTGGSSSIPAFVRILEEFFDPSIIQQRPVYTAVAEGLARQALGLWS